MRPSTCQDFRSSFNSFSHFIRFGVDLALLASLPTSWTTSELLLVKEEELHLSMLPVLDLLDFFFFFFAPYQNILQRVRPLMAAAILVLLRGPSCSP